MVSLLKTVFIVGIFLARLSSSAVLPRHDGRHHHFHAAHGAAPSAVTSSIELTVPTATLPALSSTDEASVPTYTPVIPTNSDSDSGSGSDDSGSDDTEDSDDSEDSDNSEDGSDDSDDSSDTESAEPVDSATTATVVPVPATTTQATIAIQTPAVTASTAAQASATQAGGTFWQPAAGSTWQIELSGIVTDTTYPADVFDLDLFDVPQATVDALHAAGKKVICYFSAGSFENWRPDIADFQAADKGSAMEGWDGEWWLDTRTANVRSIMTTRIALAKSKGCDGVDPDNVDGYSNSNGVGLTAADGADYLDFLADTAHAQGLSIGLKNAGDLVDSVLAKMQWHVNEQCLEFDECDLFKPFIDAGKPVFHIEYPETAPTISADVKSEKCVPAATLGFSTVLKTEALNAWIETC